MFGSNFELCWSRVRHKRAIARVLWKGIFGLSEEPERKRFHPTQKPIRLGEWFIDKFSDAGGVVVDVFLGAGCTLLASERLDRRCRAVELDPAYVAVAIDRWAEMTGGTPERVE
jgi:DNA modification methylase